jgi:hypothetical protein
VPLPSRRHTIVHHFLILINNLFIYLFAFVVCVISFEPNRAVFAQKLPFKLQFCTKKHANYAKGNYKKDPGWECAALCMHCSEADHAGPWGLRPRLRLQMGGAGW